MKAGWEGFWSLILVLSLLAAPLAAQSQSGSSAQQPPSQTPPPEGGGPQTEVGPIAVPKKKTEEQPPPAEKPKPFKNPPGMGEYSLRVDVPLVNVPVLVTTKDGQFIPGLKADNFRIYEDGVPQKVSSFSQTKDAPITAVLLTEFAANAWRFVYDAMNASYTFAQTLRPDDWVAVMYFDMKPHVVQDFTQDKRQIYAALSSLSIPTWHETNLFDALYDTLDRLDRIEGRKYIILVSTGRDTFSKLTFDNALKKIRETPNVTIFCIGTGQALLQWLDAHGYMGSITRLDYLQAENQLNTFARMTGGRAYFPRFEGEFPEIFADIGQSIRNQYVLAYHPSNAKQDGSYRKIKVELTDGQGHPLHILNQKGKDVKYMVVAREGYKAKQQVE